MLSRRLAGIGLKWQSVKQSGVICPTFHKDSGVPAVTLHGDVALRQEHSVGLGDSIEVDLMVGCRNWRGQCFLIGNDASGCGCTHPFRHCDARSGESCQCSELAEFSAGHFLQRASVGLLLQKKLRSVLAGFPAAMSIDGMRTVQSRAVLTAVQTVRPVWRPLGVARPQAMACAAAASPCPKLVPESQIHLVCKKEESCAICRRWHSGGSIKETHGETARTGVLILKVRTARSASSKMTVLPLNAPAAPGFGDTRDEICRWCLFTHLDGKQMDCPECSQPCREGFQFCSLNSFLECGPTLIT